MLELIAMGGIFLGCLSRALLPFFKKKHTAIKEGKEVKWESRYVWTIVFAIVTSFIATMLVFPTFTIPPENAFPLAFAVGWASQDIINKIAK